MSTPKSPMTKDTLQPRPAPMRATPRHGACTSYSLDAHFPFWAPPFPLLRTPFYPFDLPEVVEPIGPAAQHVLPLRQLDHELPAAAPPPRGGGGRRLLDTASGRVDIADDGVELAVLHQQSLGGGHSHLSPCRHARHPPAGQGARPHGALCPWAPSLWTAQPLQGVLGAHRANRDELG